MKSLINNYFIVQREIIDIYNEPSRHFHNLEHIPSIIRAANKLNLNAEVWR